MTLYKNGYEGARLGAEPISISYTATVKTIYYTHIIVNGVNDKKNIGQNKRL